MSPRFCISNYEPVIFKTRREFLVVYHSILLNLIGKTIEGYLLLHDVRDNEWIRDAPAILIIGGQRYEFTAFEIDYFNMTVDAVDLETVIDWYTDKDRQFFTWRQNGIKWINRIIGRRIIGINLLNSQFNRISIIDEFSNRRECEDPALAGIEFMVGKADTDEPLSLLQIYNNTDEIGLEIINNSCHNNHLENLV